VHIVLKFGGLNLLESAGPVQACNGTALPLVETITLDKEQSGKSRKRDEVWEIPEKLTCRVLGNFPEILEVSEEGRKARQEYFSKNTNLLSGYEEH
jgi:hypothetical protein